MSLEVAKQWYNLRKGKDGSVYFGFDPFFWIAESSSSSLNIPKILLDETAISNRKEKYMMYYSHISDNTDINNPLSFINKYSTKNSDGKRHSEHILTSGK